MNTELRKRMEDQGLDAYIYQATIDIDRGGYWELAPESAESGMVYYYESYSGWHRDFVETGFYIENGKLYYARWDCDVDGSWDDCPTELCEITQPGDESAAFKCLMRELDESCLRYYECVSKTGEDPCHDFNVKTEKTCKRTWQILVRPSVVGPVLLQARYYPGGRWRQPFETSKDFADYMCMARHGGKWILGIELDDGTPLEQPYDWTDLMESTDIKWQRITAAERHATGAWAKGLVTITETTPIKPLTVRRQLKLAALREVLKLKRQLE